MFSQHEFYSGGATVGNSLTLYFPLLMRKYTKKYRVPSEYKIMKSWKTQVHTPLTQVSML